MEPRSGDNGRVLTDNRWDRWKTRQRRVGVRWVVLVAVVAMKYAAVPSGTSPDSKPSGNAASSR